MARTLPASAGEPKASLQPVTAGQIAVAIGILSTIRTWATLRIVRRLVLATLLVGCGSHADPVNVPKAAVADAKLPEGPPLATPGEHMQYKLSLQGIELATYDIAMGDLTDVGATKTITVQGHAKISGLAVFLANIDDRFTSWVDITNGHPVRFQTDEYSSGSKTDIEHTVIDLAARTDDTVPVMFHMNDQPPKPEPQHVKGPVVWDYNAFLLELRAWEGPPGSTLSLDVFRSRYMWHTDVKIHGKDKIVTALGELPALRIDGITYKVNRDGARDPNSEQRDFKLWISDDDGRVPLRLDASTDYGDLKMEITAYDPGNGQRLRK